MIKSEAKIIEGIIKSEWKQKVEIAMKNKKYQQAYYWRNRGNKKFMDKQREIGREKYWRLEAGKCKRKGEYLKWLKEHMPKGDKHYKWAGDKVGYNGIHTWLNKNWKKTGICEVCHRKRKTDFALRKGFSYQRKKKNYIEICRSCHSKQDNKVKNFKKAIC